MNFLKKLFSIKEKKQIQISIRGKTIPDKIYPDEKHIAVFTYSYENMLAWWYGLTDDWKRILLLKSTFDDETKYDLSIKPEKAFLQEIFESEIFCSQYRPLKFLRPLNDLKNLKQLLLESIEVEDFTEISDLKHVTTIHAGYSKLESLDGLENFDNLKVITLANTNITTLKPIAALKRIIDLDIRGTLVNPNEVDLFAELHPNTTIDFITHMNPLRRNRESLENPLLDYFKKLAGK
jgi:Leucine-rich repeat (LRR) protein